MRLLLIGCSVLMRELSDAVAHSPHLVDARYLPAGLHDSGAVTMREQIQQAIDAAEPGKYDYILLGYGLCGNGTAGLQARSTPLVLARAHDCITLLSGSRQKYLQYFQANPGTYFRSAGWVERAEELKDQVGGMSLNTPLEAMIARYGEDAGRYLFEELNRYQKSYSRLTYIRTGLEPDGGFAGKARAEAESRHWSYEEIDGSPVLFRRLLAGDWQDDFLIVPPGSRIVAAYNEGVVSSAPVAEKA